jgi:hypothetical protein
MGLNALLAAGDWISYNTRPDRRMKGGVLSQHIAQEYKISRRQLDQAIADIRAGLAHPSKTFVNARESAARLHDRPLTAEELQGIVSAIKKTEAKRLQSVEAMTW